MLKVWILFDFLLLAVAIVLIFIGPSVLSTETTKTMLIISTIVFSVSALSKVPVGLLMARKYYKKNLRDAYDRMALELNKKTEFEKNFREWMARKRLEQSKERQ